MRRIAGSAAHRSRRERARRVYVRVEALERRSLLSTSPLVIAGTAGSDTISVSVGSDGTLHATANATTTNYTPAQYAGGIAIDTKAGGASGDSLSILSLLAVPTTIVSGGLLKETLGTDARGLRDIAATSLKLGGSTGTLQLTVNDSSDATAGHLTLDAATASGVTYDVLHGLTPGDISAAAALLVVNLGNAGNTIDVNGTAPLPPTFAVINLNTGNGNDTVNVDATAVGTILNINGQNGRDAVNVSGTDRTLTNIEGVLNVSNPLGGTDLTIDDSFELPGRAVAVTLSTFAAGGTTYGSLQGLAPAPINFAGIGLHSLNVTLGVITNASLTVNDTPGGGPITVYALSTASVLGLAAGQSLSLHATEGAVAQGVITVDFSTGRIGNGSFIFADCYDLFIDGASPSDPFVIDGGIKHGQAVIGFDTIVLDRIWLQIGSFTVTDDLSGQEAYELIANGTNTRLTYEADQTNTPVGLEIRNGAHVALANGVTVNLPAPFTPGGFIPDGTFDIGTGQAYLSYVGADVPREIRTEIASGLSGGRGITSRAADSTHGIGFTTTAGTYATEVHVKWTLYGDANLDGVVNFADLLVVAQNYGRTNATWDEGDFNYDGKVDFADLLVLAQNDRGTLQPTPAAAPLVMGQPALKTSRRTRLALR